jgi:hypothetical protein
VRHLIAQAFERGPDQSRAADAVIDEAVVVVNGAAVLGDALAEFSQLTGDGVSLGLLLGRDTSIQSNT